jgi:hypothetical protein
LWPHIAVLDHDLERAVGVAIINECTGVVVVDGDIRCDVAIANGDTLTGANPDTTAARVLIDDIQSLNSKPRAAPSWRAVNPALQHVIVKSSWQSAN